ncbi:hypothetical protein NKV53_06505 [Legionella sp. 27cVA30]|uniref:hypothetical protein n=1 Tax=Legionella sp. 27cVA30 TaxID=2905657 RepID=UPI0020A03326|nr:hypothetical protein [Legionella sp. 27cVA30]MCP0914000.1 hypothetical protein [Legionella sp. 27cVA30]
MMMPFAGEGWGEGMSRMVIDDEAIHNAHVHQCLNSSLVLSDSTPIVPQRLMTSLSSNSYHFSNDIG